jgi:predicted RNA-binding protein YlxR (DUF448 family)
MAAAARKMMDDDHDGRAPAARVSARGQNKDGSRAEARERRDIVSGEVMPDARLIRFVAAPDGTVVPDVAAKLPGRGLWVAATQKAVATAVEKKLFGKAAKANVAAASDLPARAEAALAQRMIGDLGLARRSGALVLGFDNVLRALEGPKPPKVLIEAFDGSKDGKRKLYAASHRLELDCVVIETLTSAELGLALGRENVIHAAVQPGGLAERLIFDAQRLSGFRARNDSLRTNASKNESPRAEASKNESKS